MSRTEHSKQTRSEFEHSNLLEHGTPKDQSRGPGFPPSSSTGVRHTPSSRSTIPDSGCCRQAHAQEARLVLQPEPGLCSVLPWESYLACVGCLSSWSQGEGPSVRHVPSATRYSLSEAINKKTVYFSLLLVHSAVQLLLAGFRGVQPCIRE